MKGKDGQLRNWGRPHRDNEKGPDRGGRCRRLGGGPRTLGFGRTFVFLPCTNTPHGWVQPFFLN